MPRTIDDVKTVAVVGAGPMGEQIAAQTAMHGFNVWLTDNRPGVAAEALARTFPRLERRVSKGQMTAEELEAARARWKATDDLAEAVRGADLVIEAITEELEPKRELFKQLDQLAPKHAILATNSSSMGISRMTEGVVSDERLERVCNLHYFNPVLVMELVEVVRGPRTSAETVQIALDFVKQTDRVPVLINKEVPAFIVNRILYAARLEAYWLMENGYASFQDIDTAMRLGARWPMGPFELSDLTGLEVGYGALKSIYEETGDERFKPPKTLEEKVQRGEFGKKAGKGFYDYS